MSVLLATADQEMSVRESVRHNPSYELIFPELSQLGQRCADQHGAKSLLNCDWVHEHPCARSGNKAISVEHTRKKKKPDTAD
jgi:hypothetical protein